MMRVVCTLLLLVAMQARAAAPRDLRDMLGVSHVDGRYCLTDKDFLNEGADQVLAVGSRVIKLWFNQSPAKNYPFHSQWPKIGSLVELAKSPYYKSVFDKPFTSIILETFAFGLPGSYWRDRPTDEQRENERRQFYELTKYLLTTYRGTNKTFVLQNWEGDWAVRDKDHYKDDPKPEALANMVAWLATRQAGVDQARAELGSQGVRVLHAAEVNRVADAMEKGHPRVVDQVLPRVRLDLVSYSAYDTQQDPKRFRAALRYIADHMAGGNGRGRVYVGEFGLAENRVKQDKVQGVLRDVVRAAREFDCPYAVYWQVYCNEPVRQPVRGNDDVSGFWLLRPDGSPSWARATLVELLSVKPAAGR